MRSLEIALGPKIELPDHGPLADRPVVDVVADQVARLPGAEGQIDEIAREAEDLVAECEAPRRDFYPIVEQLLIPGQFLQAEYVSAPVDFVEQLKRGDACVRSGVAAPAADQRHEDAGAGQAQALLQVELSLQGDLSGLLGVLAQAAREVHDRFVDAGERNQDAEIVQLRADARPFAEKIGRGCEIIGRQR